MSNAKRKITEENEKKQLEFACPHCEGTIVIGKNGSIRGIKKRPESESPDPPPVPIEEDKPIEEEEPKRFDLFSWLAE